MIANLSVCIARLCVCTSIEDCLSSYSWHFFSVPFSKDMVGWVTFKVSLCFMLKTLNRLKCGSQCLFLSYCNSCSACEKSFLLHEERNVLIADHHVKKCI